MSGGGWSCPLPTSRYDRVTMAHGGGGTLMQRLVRDELGALLPPEEAGALGDAAWVRAGAAGEVAMTTDSFVVRPLFFPGGDIGTLAVNGTLNDLAVSGARPVGLSVGMILEEGLDTATLRRVAASLRAAADAAGVPILTGDTKVVERAGSGGEPGLYVNTAGIGVPVVADPAKRPRPERIAVGDAVLATGSVGRHGMAVMAERHALRVGDGLTSDCASLVAPLMALWAEGIDVHCARDATRSGLGGVLCDPLRRRRRAGMGHRAGRLRSPRLRPAVRRQRRLRRRVRRAGRRRPRSRHPAPLPALRRSHQNRNGRSRSWRLHAHPPRHRTPPRPPPRRTASPYLLNGKEIPKTDLFLDFRFPIA